MLTRYLDRSQFCEWCLKVDAGFDTGTLKTTNTCGVLKTIIIEDRNLTLDRHPTCSKIQLPPLVTLLHW